MPWLRVLTARLLGRVNRDRLDDEFEEELRFHLQMEADTNLRRGMTPEQARRAARVRLGGIEGLREECRDVRGLPLVDTCMQDVRYGVRLLAKSRSFTAVAVLSLALGIGVNTAMFSILDRMLPGTLPVPNPHELAFLYHPGPLQGRSSSDEGGGAVFSYPMFRELAAEQTSFTGLAGAR